MRPVTVLFACTLACGRSELAAECRDDSQAPRGAAPVAEPGCELDALRCVPRGESLRLGSRGVGEPAVVAVAGGVLALTFDPCGAKLTGVTLPASVRWSRRLNGAGEGRLAFRRGAAEGLVSAGRAVWRLGSDGQVRGAGAILETPPLDLLAHASGFAAVLLAAAGGAAYGAFGDERVPQAFLPFGSPPVSAAHHADDEAGVARAIGLSSDLTDDASLWTATPPVPEAEEDHPAYGAIVAMTQIGNEVFSLSVFTGEHEPAPCILWLRQWHGGQGDVVATVPDLASTRAALVGVGGRLVIVSPHIHPSGRLAFAVDDTSVAPDQLGELVELGAAGPLHFGPAAAPTPRGFAVVWVEAPADGGPSVTKLQDVECCRE